MPPPPAPEPQWPIPTFNVRIEDLAHPGAKLFLDNIRVDEALRHAVTTVCRLLYTEQTVPREYVLGPSHSPNTPSYPRFACSRAGILGVLSSSLGHDIAPMTHSGGCPRRCLFVSRQCTVDHPRSPAHARSRAYLRLADDEGNTFLP